MRNPPKTETPWTDVPDAGEIAAVGVPRLLAQAWRDERTGLLELNHGERSRRVRIRSGAPLDVGGNGEDRFAHFLASAGLIDADARTRVERLASDKGCNEASAVLALRLLDAKSLYAAMRHAGRDAIAALFCWSAGSYRWTEADEASRDDKARPFDLLALLQKELPERWGLDGLFAEIRTIEHLCGDVAPRNRKIVQKLGEAAAPAARALSLLDGHRPLGRVLGDCAGDPIAASTLWSAAYCGLIRLRAPSSTDAALPDGSLHFDFEIHSSGTSSSRSTSETGTQAARKESDAKAESLRADIAARLEEISRLDHYGMLGLSEDADAPQIKKAYFRAAKKYHPDALARLGLESLKDDAARVFARIAEAFEVLSDPEKKQAYDSAGNDEPEIDGARLAQAETAFRKGEILAKMGNFEGALEYLEPAVAYWPEESAYQSGLGWALYKQPRTDLERAKHHLDLALSRSPQDATVCFRLGLVLRSAGETTRADELLAKARALDPSLTE